MRRLPALLLPLLLAGTTWAQPAGTVPPTAAVVPPVAEAQAQAGEAAAPHEGAAPEHDPATAPLAGEEAPHAAAAAHEGARHGGQAIHPGEGVEHGGGPVIENWWSWDYGPGKTHHHPPFGFALINFLIYLYVLQRLAWGSFQAFMKNRHLGVRRALDEAAEIRGKAEAQLRAYEARLAGLDAEIAGVVATVRKEAEGERARIIAAAEAQAVAMQKDAEAQVRAEIDRARADLRRQVALAAAEAAETILRAQMQPDDQKRLEGEYVARLESIAGMPPRATTPPRPPAR